MIAVAVNAVMFSIWALAFAATNEGPYLVSMAINGFFAILSAVIDR